MQEMRTEDLVKELRDHDRATSSDVWFIRQTAADRLEAISTAWGRLEAFIAYGGSGTYYVRDNDESRDALLKVRRAITGETE